MAVSFRLLVTCWERADLLALLYVMFSYVTFPYGVLGQVWCLIVSIPIICLCCHLSDVFLGLICVQTICKCYQQTTKVVLCRLNKLDLLNSARL